jgi:flagellar biosynthetic protein FliR
MSGLGELSALTSRHLETFLLVFFRFGGMVVVAPVLGHRSIPVPHRIALAGLLALVLTPLYGPVRGGRTEDVLGLGVAIAGELLIGLAIGFVASLVMAAVQVAGELIGYQMGFGIAALYDPAVGSQVTVVTRFLDLVALLLVLAVNGHHLLIRAVAGSFQRIPPAGVTIEPALSGAVAGLGAKLFRSGLELAAPIVGLLLIVNLTLALLTRVAPQTNVFAVGLPVTVAAGLFALVQIVPLFAQALSRLLAELGGDLHTVLQGAAHGLR